mgnify:CR=1 FL=1
MKVYVWENVGGLTSSWHSGGGAVVVAETEDEALAMLREAAQGEEGLQFYQDSDEVPMILGEIEGAQKRVLIFPDAGCC